MARLVRPGDVVVDVGCGTGLSFPALEAGIGPEGRIIGIELSPEMLDRARQRIEAHGWSNVTLVQSAAEDAVIPDQAVAALFFLTHDILRTPPALRNVLAQLKPGARVASLGAKWARPKWLNPVNLAVWLIARRYVTTFEGFARPWNHLQALVPDLEVRSIALGGAYVAWGSLTREG